MLLMMKLVFLQLLLIKSLSQIIQNAWISSPDIVGMNVICTTFDSATPISSAIVAAAFSSPFKTPPTVVAGFRNFAAEIGNPTIYFKVSIIDTTTTGIQIMFQITQSNLNKMIHSSIIAFNLSNLAGVYIMPVPSVTGNSSQPSTLPSTNYNWTCRPILNSIWIQTARNVYFSHTCGMSFMTSTIEIWNNFVFSNHSINRFAQVTNIIIQRTVLGSIGIEIDQIQVMGSIGTSYYSTFQTRTAGLIMSLTDINTTIDTGFNATVDVNYSNYGILATVYSGAFTLYRFPIIGFRIFNCSSPLYYYSDLNPLSCFQICPNRSYPNVTICSRCYYQCQTCVNNSTCVTCSLSNRREFNPVNNTCKCMSGSYEEWSFKSQYCYSCPSNCSTCWDYSECKSCNITRNLTFAAAKGSYCYCVSDLYLYQGSSCTLCSDLTPGCKLCAFSNTCTNCYTDNYFILNSGNRCECVNNSYAINTTTQCSLCSDLMGGCLTCSSNTSCLTCSTPSYRKVGSLCQCNEQLNYTAKGNTCVLCSSEIIGCLNCSSPTTCTDCNTAGMFVLSGGICVCQDKYFLSGSVCLPCHYSCQKCTGSAQSQCTLCDSGAIRELSSTRCPCKLGYYDGGVALCLTCMITCLGCNNGNSCSSCDSNKNFTLNGNLCQCTTDHYLKPDKTCIACSDLIPHCLSCTAYNSCTTCMTPNYTILNPSVPTSCDCNTNQQYFPSSIPKNCLNCSDLINGCTSCNSNVSCASCHPVNFTLSVDNTACRCSQIDGYFPLFNNCTLCKDLIFGCLDCQSNSTCLVCDQAGFFIKIGNICECIDGYFLSEKICKPCKVSCLKCVGEMDHCTACNSSNLRYLQSSNCLCISPFDDCMQSNLTECNHTQCSYLKTPTIKVSSLIKNPSQNSLTFYISISPTTPDFDTVDFNSIFDIGLPPGTTITYQYSNGIIIAHVDYYQDLQGFSTNITLKLTLLDSWYFDLTPDSTLNYTLSPTNNLASNIYSPEIYSQRQLLTKAVIVTVAISFVCYLAGLFSSRIVSSEMLSSVQISYLGLFIVNNHDPLIEPLRNLKYTHGFNTLFDTLQHSEPNRIYSAGYTASIVANLNLMLLLMLIPLTLALVFFIIHKKSTKWRIMSDKAWRLMLGEGMLTTLLLSLYNFSSSLGVFVVYGSPKSSYFAVSIFQILIYGGLIGVCIWILVSKDGVWLGEYRTMFNWNVMAQKYYLVPIIQRMVVGLLLSALNFSFASGIISLLILVGCTLLIGIKRPFVHSYHNYRSISHLSIAILILILYLVLSINSPSKKQGPLTYIPYGILILIIANIVIGLIFIIKGFFVLKDNKRKESASEKIENQELKMERQMQSKAIEMFNQTKNSNIKEKLLQKNSLVNVNRYQSKREV